MSETVNQGTTDTQPTEEGTARTFSQTEVDAIVKERLTRDRAKYADYDALREKALKLDQIEEASKTELQKAQERANALDGELRALKQENALRELRQAVAAETGVPVGLLTATTEEALKEQANSILDFARPGYPIIRDAGELPTVPHTKRTTRDQFAEWFGKL